MSIFFSRCDPRQTVPETRLATLSGPIAKLELHGDFDDHVHWCLRPACRRITPLPDGLHRAVVEAGTQALPRPRQKPCRGVPMRFGRFF